MEEEVCEKLPEEEPGEDALGNESEEADKRRADHTTDQEGDDIGEEKKLNDG